MASKQVRMVNVVPQIRIKKEILDEDEDDCIKCLICDKSFANQMALGNHARMEHMEAYATGDESLWSPSVPLKPIKIEKNKEQRQLTIVQRTERLISSMEPTNLMALANDDVSYILIKSEIPPQQQSSFVRERKRKAETEKVVLEKKKEKEIQPITGPFECLQPSTLVADGTCHQIFFSCCEYSIHFRDDHTRRRKGLRCQVCEKPLVGGGEEPQSPYPCEVCGAGFNTNKQLSNHMATDHIKLKPFECSVCHKRFTQQGGVQQHMRMHTGDRPFSCTFCPKAFTQKSGLDQHLRIHTKVKPYRCVICSKTFCQSVHLKQHMRTHTNVSPFQCGICNKRFKQSSHLNYHLKNHNQAAMTAEQREQYHQLVSMIAAPVRGRADPPVEAFEEVHTEVDSHEDMLAAQTIQLAEEETEGDGEELQELQEEQVEEMEGEILQEDDEGETEEYIVGDDGQEVWQVKYQ